MIGVDYLADHVLPPGDPPLALTHFNIRYPVGAYAQKDRSTIDVERSLCMLRFGSGGKIEELATDIETTCEKTSY